jgi:sugar O-acyltransferase (sialic acid O-acetyltransferase NeuD family)
MKETFDILGFSPSLISMVSDILVKTYGNKLKIRIIKNMDSTVDIPFKIAGVDYTEIFHDEWKSPSKNILMGVYKVKSKRAVYEFFKDKYSIGFKNYINVIHPGTDLAFSVNLGKGIFCNYGVSIGPFTNIGNLVTINRHAGIGHHVKISDFCVINPNAHIAGLCNIGRSVTIGMGTNIIDGISIGEHTIIAAGSLVTKDLPDHVVAFGVPARIIGENKL